MGRLAGEAIMRGAHLFVPGTLALSTGIARGDLVAVAVGVEVTGTNNNNSKWGMTRGTLLGVDPARDAQLPDRSRWAAHTGAVQRRYLWILWCSKSMPGGPPGPPYV